jgi:hypothetical protein
VTYRQFAVANALRAKKLKPQIQAASDRARMELIHSCYDWRTELRFFAPK